MNALAQEQLQRQADSIPILKREIEREFYESIKFCNCCQRPGEWKKKCGRCKEAYYCSRECQKWAWPVHKRHCYAPGAERPPRPARKPAPKKPDVVREEQVDLTDKALRVFFLEGCTDIDAATEKCRRALPATFERAFVSGGNGATVVLEAPDKKLLEREDVLTFHVAKVFCEMKAKPFSLPEKFIVPLSKTPPILPSVKLDDATPVAFAGFCGLGEAFVKAITSDKTLLSKLAGSGSVSRLAGYDDNDVPKPCKGMPSACLIFFAGLHDEFPDLPKLFAHVHGSCRNNIVAAALAKKALFYRVEAIDEYASPVASKECLVNSRGVAIDCARAFASATLCELASLNERELELRYGVEVASSTVSCSGKLLE